jgi:hypothetical protein
LKPTPTPLYQTNSPHLLQPCQKILYFVHPVGKPFYACISSLPPDVALREPTPFSPLETSIHRRQRLFPAPASLHSSCLPF